MHSLLFGINGKIQLNQNTTKFYKSIIYKKIPEHPFRINFYIIYFKIASKCFKINNFTLLACSVEFSSIDPQLQSPILYTGFSSVSQNISVEMYLHVNLICGFYMRWWRNSKSCQWSARHNCQIYGFLGNHALLPYKCSRLFSLNC